MVCVAWNTETQRDIEGILVEDSIALPVLVPAFLCWLHSQSGRPMLVMGSSNLTGGPLNISSNILKTVSPGLHLGELATVFKGRVLIGHI